MIKSIFLLKSPAYSNRLRRAYKSPGVLANQQNHAATVESLETKDLAPWTRIFNKGAQIVANARMRLLLPKETKQNWSQTLDNMENIVYRDKTVKSSSLKATELVKSELKLLTKNICSLLKSKNSGLQKITDHYFHSTLANGKRIRPLVVLLTAQALSKDTCESNNDINSSLNSEFETSSDQMFLNNPYFQVKQPLITPAGVSPSQRRLAEITELIHTASLMHDDVIDGASLRRGSLTINASHGNKIAILAGDYLLSRASVALARLQNPQVIELLATVLADLVDGELTPSIKPEHLQSLQNFDSKEKKLLITEMIGNYLRRSEMKTASLFAKSCRACAILQNATIEIIRSAEIFGKNLGITFQIIDDILDITSIEENLGKPVAADMHQGLATAPVLYAAIEFPKILVPILERGFSNADDSKIAIDLIYRSNGIQKSLELANFHAKLAKQAIENWQPSPAKSALIEIVDASLTRVK